MNLIGEEGEATPSGCHNPNTPSLGVARQKHPFMSPAWTLEAFPFATCASTKVVTIQTIRKQTDTGFTG